ncbi:MAG: SGNH/GDSL hydrolase family protein [Oscillospiraceae bacterium]|nr:SGNH/GDSL hydrolase family protein [Oscillospiraceae bacterium]
MKKYEEINFAVDGDSITEGGQWSRYAADELGFASLYNVAVGSSVWYKRRMECGGVTVTTQSYFDPGFAGISNGWEPTDDIDEIQRRANNCAVVHTERYISDVKKGIAPVPDVFAFAMGVNDDPKCNGSIEQALLGKTLDEVDLFTAAGAVRWCIQRVMEEFPGCRVFVLTPLQTADPAHNLEIEETAGLLRKIAGAMSAQVIDCYHGCGICEKFENIGTQGRYLRDGLHPDEEGQRLQGAFAAKELKNNMF